MRQTVPGRPAEPASPLPAPLRRRTARLCQAVRERRAMELLYGGVWRVVHPHAIGRMGTGRMGLLTWQTAGLARGPRDAGEGWRMFDVARIEATRALRVRFTPRPREGAVWTEGIGSPLAEAPSRGEAFSAALVPA